MPVKLQTTIKIPAPPQKLCANSTLCGIGSCFSQNVLQRFFDCGFKGAQNPNGIVYNAVSINDALQTVASNKIFTEADFFEHNNLWHSWEHHGNFSNKAISTAVEKVNTSTSAFRSFVKNCDAFVMTPSSSVVYEFNETGKIVANCHKVPNHLFTRRLLSVEENIQSIMASIASIRSLNKTCMIIITLSPVRHYPGDLLLNTRSKANLLAAIGSCLDQHPDLIYFPSYEIVLDELRDYRFYADDLLHVSKTTETIIFERFIASYFDSESIDKIRQGQKAAKAAKHITLHK